MKTIRHHVGLTIRAGIGYALVLWAGGIAFVYLALDLIQMGNAKHAFLYLGIGVVAGLGGTLLSFKAGRRACRFEDADDPAAFKVPTDTQSIANAEDRGTEDRHGSPRTARPGSYP